MTVNTNFGVYKNCHLKVDKYVADDSLAIEIITVDDGFEEPLARITVCLNDTSLRNTNKSYVDINNCPWALDFISEYGLGEDTDMYGISGYCTYPLVEFNIDVLKSYTRG